MATAHSGALVGGLNGRVGGAVFRRGDGTIVVQGRTMGRAVRTELEEAQRLTFASVVTAWRGLSVTERDVWNQWASMQTPQEGDTNATTGSGFTLFVEYQTQCSGRVFGGILPPPGTPDRATAKRALGLWDNDGFWLTGWDRVFGSFESQIIKLSVPFESQLAAPRGRIYGDILTMGNTVAGPTLGSAQRQSVTGVEGFGTGNFRPLTSYSVECWIKLDVVTPIVGRLVWYGGGPGLALIGTDDHVTFLADPGVSWPGAPLPVGQWTQQVITANGDTGEVRYYQDGNLVGPVQTTGVLPIEGVFTYGGLGGMPGIRLEGCLSMCKVSGNILGSSDVFAHWGGGIGGHIGPIADCLGCWTMYPDGFGGFINLQPSPLALRALGDVDTVLGPNPLLAIPSADVRLERAAVEVRNRSKGAGSFNSRETSAIYVRS